MFPSIIKQNNIAEVTNERIDIRSKCAYAHLVLFSSSLEFPIAMIQSAAPGEFSQRLEKASFDSIYRITGDVCR